MTVNFPTSPSDGTIHTSNTKTWTYDSAKTKWKLNGASGSSGRLNIFGNTTTTVADTAALNAKTGMAAGDQIYVEDINKVVLSGSGEIFADFPLEGNHFKTFLSGSGEINLNLDVTAVNGTVTGSGEITLTVKASKVNFNVTGSGDIEADGIKADTAEARVTGSGDIVCKGNPRKQKTKVTGSGEIIVQN